MIIPGLADGNDALNALAIGLIQRQLIAGVPAVPTPSICRRITNFNHTFTSMNDYDKYECFKNLQQRIASELRSRLLTSLQNSFIPFGQVNVGNLDLKKLFPIFEQAFLKYYAIKSDINFVEDTSSADSLYGHSLPAAKFYRDQFYQLFTQGGLVYLKIFIIVCLFTIHSYKQEEL